MIATRTMSPTLLAAAEIVGTDGILGFCFCALRATPGMVKESLEKRRADNVEAFGGQLQKVWFNDVDLNRVND